MGSQFLLILSLFSAVSTSYVFGPQPKILSIDGHLTFKAAEHRNISFETQGDGKVHVNGVDLTKAAQIAHSAVQAMNKYQTSFESYFEKVNKFEKFVDSDDGLLQKLLLLQNGSKNTTTISDGSVNLSIRRLNRRVQNIQRRLRRINSLLSTNECESYPCQHGGTCYDLYNSFMCNCPKEWEGSLCEKDVNECAKFAGTDLGCQNGATCVNRQGYYECLCPHGWYGTHCTRRSRDCNSGSSTELCGHGTCIPQNNENGYKCLCEQGWTTDGSTPACNIDVNECTMSRPPCSVNPPVNCVNLPGSFTCGGCPPGYSGNGFYCTDINECEMFNGGCSVNPMVQCMNTLGSRICGSCPAGYVGDGQICSYEGVCSVNNGGCHHLATCRNNPRISSTFIECVCPPGYIGNGLGRNGCMLSSLNPCTPNPCVHGICVNQNTTNTYACHCTDKRYTGVHCDVLRDFCNPNPCQNGGSCITVGIRRRCSCTNSFTGPLCQEERQSCGGRLETESGVLVYPTIQAKYRHNTNCAWTIETNNTKVLNITFKRFHVEGSQDCQYDWLQIHDGRNTLAHSFGRFCGDQLPNGGVITSTHHIIYLWFRSDSTIAHNGFELSWESIEPICGDTIIGSSHGIIQSPGSPGKYPNNRDCYWNVIAPIGKRLLFHFFSIMIGTNSDCSQDYIEFINGNVPGDVVFEKYCNTSHPPPLYSPGSEVLIHFHSDATKNYPGFQITYSVVEGIPGCGGVYTSEVGEIHSPMYDGKYPHDMSCEYRILLNPKTRIKLTFSTFALEQSDGCRFDYVAVHQGSTLDSPLIGRYCGKNAPAPYISQGNEVFIHFKSDWASSEEGFVLKYESVCGGTFTDSNGVIELTRSALTSLQIRSCTYEIVQPIGTVITLNINATDIFPPQNQDCRFQYIEIRDGDSDNSTLIGKYCTKAPPQIISSFNYLWIKVHQSIPFPSDIQAYYTTTKMGCGGILKEKIGTISSPQHPDVYPTLSNCKWILSAPPGCVIQLVWMSFHLEESYKCSYDSIVIYDNNTETGMGGVIGPYCGHAVPPMLLSSSNLVTIVFVSDSTIASEGFLASYSFINERNVCGGNYFTSAGVIKSQDYPNNYPVNTECVWTITVPPGHQIMLNVTDFNIESYSHCRYDWLEIHNGGAASSPLIGRYCGTVIPKLIPSHANKLYIHFKSDMTKTGHGFKIIWDSAATGCGGSLNAPTGTIISPHYPEPYTSESECTWKISVSAGSLIQVVFTDLDLEMHRVCLLDYVELYDGLTLNSKSLGRFCSQTNLPYIRSSKNNMLVKFESDVSQQGRGFQLQYTTMCNNTVTGFMGVIESPNFPNGYPHDLHCIWDIKVADKNKINITFSHFELETTGLPESAGSLAKACAFDFVEIHYKSVVYDYQEPQFVKKGTYCGDQVPPLMTLDSDHVRVKFVSDNLLLGSGFRLEWQIEGCGGLLTKPIGNIQTPNYPHAYPSSIKCEWKFLVDYGSSIEITFNEIDIEKDVTCSYDSVAIYNGQDDTYPALAKFCHQNKPVTLTSTGNEMYIVFIADASYSGKGFSADYSTVPSKCGGKFTASTGNIMSPNYPKNYESNVVCEWLIEMDENHLIELTFEDIDLPSEFTGNCSENNQTFVKVYDGPFASYPLLAKVCQKDKLNTTITSSYNFLFIEMVANSSLAAKGFSAKYKKACGARIVTSGSGTIRLNQYDVTDVDICNWTIVATDPSKHIYLTITLMNTQESITPLEIYDGESVNAPLIGSYQGRKIPPMIISDGSAIHISVSALESQFFATYSVYESACGGELLSLDGFFGSPGHPKQYPDDQECEWTLSVAEGNHVSLNFAEFQLLKSERCNTDYLEIRSGNSSGKLLGVFCGEDSPSNITHAGSLWIYLKTTHMDGDNSLNSAKGFLAEYALNHENELSGPFGRICSPLYPLGIPTTSVFDYTIRVNNGKRILLTIKDLYLIEPFPDMDCSFDGLLVTDGTDSSANSLGQFCGLTLPDPVKSTNNVMFIRASFSYSTQQSKFMMEWREVGGSSPVPNYMFDKKRCGSNDTIDIHSISNNSMILTSPGYPDGYENNLLCDWYFSTIPMNHIKIFFTVIAFERAYMPSGFCYQDYVEVFQKTVTDVDWKSIGKYCNHNDTKVIHGSNLIKVSFISNRFMNGTGFSAKIAEECGGVLTDPSGYVYFNNESQKAFGSKFKTDCQWNVTVRPGRTIEVEIESINIEKVDDNDKLCPDYLMLRNGKFSDSPLLGNGKYCGKNVPPVLKTSGNNLYIKYSGRYPNSNFKIFYRESSHNCGGQINLAEFASSIQIKSPNYPEIPPTHVECIWVIMAPSGESLRIDFINRFDLQSSNGCLREAVEVRNGGTEYSPLIGRYCRNIPSSQFTSDNIIYVKFFTDVDDPGNGFNANISIAKCGGTIRGSSGVLSSPIFINPSYHKTINCTWTIIAPLDHTMKLHFTKIDLPIEYSNCQSSDHVLIKEENRTSSSSTLYGYYCGKQIPPDIETGSNQVIVSYQKLNKNSIDGGFSINYTSSSETCGGSIDTTSGIIQSPGYPHHHKSFKSCTWFLTVPFGRRITVKFLDFDIDTTKRNGDLVFYNDHELRSIIGVASKNYQRGFRSSTNTMLIIYWSIGSNNAMRGFKLRFTSDEPTPCIGDFSQDSGVIKQPTNYTDPFWCIYKRDTSSVRNQTVAVRIKLSTPVRNYSCNPGMSGVFLTVDNRFQRIGAICTNTEEFVTLRSPLPITYLQGLQNRMHSVNYTVNYESYPCGGIINGQSGTITSPGYPNKYTKSVECSWRLELPESQRIKLTVNAGNFGKDCTKSYLDIFNGKLPTKPRIGRYCQNDIPKYITGQSNYLWIDYKFDKDSDGTGFSIKYEPIIDGCGGTFHDRNRIIQTPSYPDDYPINSECLWEIVSEPGFFISLKFTSRFQIEDSEGCKNDYLEIWDWKDNQWVSLGKKCGREIPQMTNSTSDRMKLMFRSNERINGAGFLAQWEWNCGGTFIADETERFIVSPGYPVAYKPNTSCLYQISSLPFKTISVKFYDMQLEGKMPICRYDNLTISRSPSFTRYSNAHAEVFCGDQIPPEFIMNSAFYISFMTDRFLQRSGFRFSYKLDSCDESISTPGVISSPTSKIIRAPGSYHTYLICTWNITAPPKKVIVLEFEVFHFIYRYGCFFDGLEVFDGPSANNTKRLANLCGDLMLDPPFSITSTSNQMFLKLKADRGSSARGFKANVFFSHGPSEGCGGEVNLTDAITLMSPNLSDLDCIWILVAPFGSYVQIKFTELNLPTCKGWNRTSLEIKDGASPIAETIETICNATSVYLGKEIVSSGRRAQMRLHTTGLITNAFKATVTSLPSPCGPVVLNVTDQIQVLTSPNYPNSYDANIKCTWVIKGDHRNRMMIRFVDFDLHEQSDPNSCDGGDSLKIIDEVNNRVISDGLGPYAVISGSHKKNTSNFHLYSLINGVHEFCGTSGVPFDYYANRDVISVTFTSTMATKSRGKGFKLEYHSINCNRNFTSLQGRFLLSKITDCYASIEVPKNYTISIYFQYFVLFPGNCEEMGLEMRDGGKSGKLLTSVCGSTKPDPIFSSTNKVWIHVWNKRKLPYFTSVDLVYTSSELGRGCGGTLYNYRGLFSSPLYPNQYRESTTCTWDVRVPYRMRVALKFNTFDIKGDCLYNYVSVTTYIGETSNERKYCENDIPARLYSNYHMTVSYKSSWENNGRGWLAAFEAITDSS